MLNKKISFPPHIMFQNFDNEAVLLNINTQDHFGLDPIASLFIKALTDGLNTAQATASILDEYDVSKEQLNQDLENLIQTLLDNALIELT